MIEPSQARVRETFDYDAMSGRLYWRHRGRSEFASLRAWAAWNSRYAGQAAGTVKPSGYLEVRVDGRMMKAHRVVWIYAFGSIGGMSIDHKNGDRSDNHLDNLRLVTVADNARNKAAPRKQGLLPTGVKWQADMRKYTARVRVNRKDVHLGSFSDLGDAVAARENALAQYGFSPRHGKDICSHPKRKKEAA